MYTSLLTSLLVTTTALAARLPLGPGHFPIIPSKFDPNFAYPPAKRDSPVSDLANSVALAAASDTLSESSTPPPPSATSELVSPTTLATVTSTASAVPTSTVPAVLNDTMAGVYVCDDINWHGSCSHKFTKPGGSDVACAQLSSHESSLGPDPGFLCEFYTNPDCRKILADGSDFLSLAWPGNADLRRTEKGDRNDGFFSFACFEV